jgi:hypothetical protein
MNSAKALLLAFLVPVAVIPARGEQASPGVKVLGIINLPGWKRAILEYPNPSAYGRRTVYTILGEGDSDGEISVSQIRLEDGTVRGRLKGHTEFESALRTNNAPRDLHSVELDGVDLNTMLRLYGDWSKKTLLRWPMLPTASFSISGSPTNQTEAAKFLESAIAGQSIVCIPDGDKFIMVVPKDAGAEAHPRSSRIKASEQTDPKDMLAPGTFYFMGADLHQFLAVYADLLGSELDRTSPVRAGSPVFLRSENVLSKAECLYAFETILGWQNLKLVPAAAGFVKAVPLSESK